MEPEISLPCPQKPDESNL